MNSNGEFFYDLSNLFIDKVTNLLIKESINSINLIAANSAFLGLTVLNERKLTSKMKGFSLEDQL